MILGSTMLEVAIGLIFVYLLLSLLCSAFLELIHSLFRFRARDLERGIGRLLSDPKLAGDFFNHPLIKPLYENRRPSYIPARTFSLALWNMATTAAARVGLTSPSVASSPRDGKDVIAGVTKDLKLLRDTILALPDDILPRKLKQSLVTLMDEADNNFDKARENIEDWYNDAMDRVSGVFKRRTHYMLLVLGFAIALAMNVDTFNIFKALSNNEDLRKTVLVAAENYAEAPLPGSTPMPTPTPGESTESTVTDEERAKQAEAQFNAANERIAKIKGQIYELGLPIGWDCGWRYVDPKSGLLLTDEKSIASAKAAEQDSELKCGRIARNPRGIPDDYSGWPLKLGGILLTALAVSQGAPFWFDLLNKFIVIRSTVKPREKSQDQPSKDRPTDSQKNEAENKG